MNSSQAFVVEISVRLYRLFLYLYPRDHREEYSWLMVQLFRDKAYDACHRNGLPGILVYWLKTFLDLFVSVVREQQEHELTPSAESLVRSYPYFLMAGGASLATASISQLQPDDHYSFYGVYAISIMGLPVAIITLVAGLYGMRNWFRNQVGLLGRLGMQASILGGGIAPVLMLMLPLGEVIWSVMILGVVLLFGGSAMMGLDLLATKSMPAWIALLFIGSGTVPFVTVFGQPGYYGPRYVSFAGMFLAGICWVLIGNYLRQKANFALA